MSDDAGPLDTLRRLYRLIFWVANPLGCLLLALMADDWASRIGYFIAAIVVACLAYAYRSSWMPRRAVPMPVRQPGDT